MKLIPLDFTIETQRLKLKAADLSDVDFVWSATRFDGFNDGLTWNPPSEKAELFAAAERNINSWQKGRAYMFTSELSDNGESVGRTGVTRMNSDSEWSFGFWVHPNYWGNGYATEAGRAVLHFGFTQLMASKIVTAHATWNNASKCVIEKLGFRFLGENPCGFEKNGKPVAEYEYEMSTAAL